MTVSKRRRVSRNAKLIRSNGEHRDRAAGWRIRDGHVELWFSGCNGGQSHVGLYFPSCGACNVGTWTRTSVAMPVAS